MIGPFPGQILAAMNPGTGDSRGKSMADPDLIVKLILRMLAGFFIAMRPVGVRRCRDVARDVRGVGFQGIGKRVG